MQRDMGNEVIVAIAAVGILAFAITFAIILSLSNTPEVTATATITVVDTGNGGSPAVTVATSVAGGVSEVPPTEDTAATFTAIAATIETIQTSTGVPFGETAVITKTTEPILTEGSATSRSDTPEPQLISATPSPGQTRTVATATPRKPTATKSFTPTFTASPVPPSKTPKPTNTPTPIPTLTRTLRPTETSGIRPTPTGFPTSSVFASPTRCVPPQGWVLYVVGQGDTLFKIAQAVGSNLAELQTANCLQNINNIFAGTPIYVPQLPTTPINPYPPEGQMTLIPGLQAEGCTDPNSQITNLQPGQIISGTFNVMGTAYLADFWYYKLEVRPDFATIYNFYSKSDIAIVDGSLGAIDQAVFGTGLHWIKLTVIGKSDGAEPCAIPVMFQ